MKKLLTIGTVLALAFSATACKKKEEAKTTTETKKPADTKPVTPPPVTPPAAPPTAAATGTGVPECDEYVATFEKLAKCDKLGPAADGMKQGFEATKSAWASWATMDDATRKAAQAAAGPGCKAGSDGLKQTATSMGCTL
jgi:hypothetical protein